MVQGDLDNDTRGWIMCAVSGIACVAGASIICIDVFVRLIPGQRQFRIQDSNVFLACSLSLSFGVMMFSALYSMLPSAMRYLVKDDWDRRKAGFLMMGCFLGGFFGIQLISHVLHQYIPSHIVECDHTHEEIPDEESLHHRHHHHSRAHLPKRQSRRLSGPPSMVEVNEVTPLLPTERNAHIHTPVVNGNAEPRGEVITHFPSIDTHRPSESRRPSFFSKRVMSFFTDTKPNCDQDGPCFGYTDPCGQECFKHVNGRTAILSRNATTKSIPATICEGHGDSRHSATSPHHHSHNISRSHSTTSLLDHHHPHHHHPNGHMHAHEESHPHTAEQTDASSIISCCSHPSEPEDNEHQHHHHVPTNAFLAIGLQTVIAIAVHKLPEGFITYATNHVNSSLGFNVFMALFVHNIAEGFAMSLPLYMALGSRFKAIAWSSLLGGLSQPLGAGMAAVWFKIANGQQLEINATAYAVIFAATAGIMTSVALQLFAESLGLGHDRRLSVFWGVVGMVILGVSNSLVEGH
ncbi:putative zinc transporter [Triangularia verruculosa]|uniref:Zinc transporter n=1 Tax=Triangularia verruculosa TaxID=2587418 RepID=A0AAN7AZA3_9PEZI|nr:putative zinc transporter [Triangularia verruculosa]